MHFPFSPSLADLFGPFSINAYGLMVALSIFTFVWSILKDPRRKPMISKAIFLSILYSSVIYGIIFTRIFYAAENFRYFLKNPLEIFAIWDGGLSLLGALIGVPVILIFKLRQLKIHTIKFFDLSSTHLPLIIGISRLGCFWAGCCHGAVAAGKTFFSVIYTHPESLAPTWIPLYPTQIYSALSSLAIFAFLYIIARITKIDGLITSLFFALEGLERFAMDFLRGDRSPAVFMGISWYQSLALLISFLGFFGVVYSILKCIQSRSCQ
ncbi:prolipoprotein diacylglyceryl transferase [Candidatus Dependentiae bacterium]